MAFCASFECCVRFGGGERHNFSAPAELLSLVK
jgi:hypothetical protein